MATFRLSYESCHADTPRQALNLWVYSNPEVNEKLSLMGLPDIPKELQTIIKDVTVSADEDFYPSEEVKDWLRSQDPGYVRFSSWNQID
jgi:hypothetical protein